MIIYIEAPFSENNRQLILSAAKDCVVADSPEEAEILVGKLYNDMTYPNLKFLQLCSAGAENYCCNKLIPKNALIANATGVFGEVISEYIIGAVLSVYRKLFDYRKNQHEKKWLDLGAERTLFGERALILGCGDIGRNTAKRLKAFGVNTVGIRKRPHETDFFDEVYGTDRLDAELPKADLVICCLPKTPLTEKMLDAEKVALLKKNALLVNVGRGAVFDEKAVIAALENNSIFGAILDVFEKEPLEENSKLWSLPNVFVTPHISGVSFGHSPRTEQLIAEICAENIANYLAGKPLRNLVDREAGYANAQNQY